MRSCALRVPQEKLLHVLQAQGLVSSAGEIANIRIQQHRGLCAEERTAGRRAGLQTTSSPHIDDPGARRAGVNPSVSTRCTPLYASFCTHRHTHDETVAGLLALREAPASSDSAPATLACGEGPASQARCPELPAEPKRLGDSVPMLISADAPQFRHQTEYQGRCRVQEARQYTKLQPFFASHHTLVDDLRGDIWDDSDRRTAYTTAPTAARQPELSAAFDARFSRTTGYAALDQRMARTRQQKAALLLVLDFPEVPLENRVVPQ